MHLMTFRNISLVLLSAITVEAAESIKQAFQEGKLVGRIRSHYVVTDWDREGRATADGLALGGSLIYKTAPLGGLSIGTGLYTTQNPFGVTDRQDGETANTSKDLFARGPGSTYDYGRGYAVLAQAYIQYDFFKTNAKMGRMLMSNPWISPNDTKMIPIAIEGAQVVSNDIADTTIQIDYAHRIKERGMDYFGNMADTGDTPTKISAYYATHYTNGTHGDAPGVVIAGVKNRSIKGLELQGWVMHWDDLVDQYMIEAGYTTQITPLKFNIAGRYIRQDDKGAGNIILPATNNNDNDNSVDTSLFALRTSAEYGAVKLTLATARTASGADLIAPWRGFPTQEFTRSMTQTDWTANTKSYKAQLDYDFSTLIPGFSTLISYSFYDRDPTKKPYQSLTNRAYQNGDTRQINWDSVYKCSGELKGLELKARLMDQENDTTQSYSADTSNQEMRLEANYIF
jgi:hypothetical protein